MSGRLAELVELARDDALSPADSHELALDLAQPEARAAAVAQWRDGLLLAALAARPAQAIADLVGATAGARPSQVRRRVLGQARWRQRSGWLLAAGVVLAVGLLALALALALWPGPRMDPALASLHRTSAGLVVVRHGQTLEAHAGLVLQAEDRIRTAAAGAELLYPDGTRLDLQAATTLQIREADGAKQVQLDAGGLECRVAQQPAGKPMRLQTEQAALEVVGTRLRLRAGPDSTRLDVEEGRVRFMPLGGEAVMVEAGRSAVANRPVDLMRQGPPGSATNAHWTRGLPSDPGFFPIAVWLQDPAYAEAYRKAGINIYLGLPDPATASSLAALSAAGMQVICHQDAIGPGLEGNGAIVGWLNTGTITDRSANDEGSDPQAVLRGYDARRARDPSRPLYVHLYPDQGASWNGYPGLGNRRAYTAADYGLFTAAGDILGLEVFPINTGRDLQDLGRGLDRLRERSGGARPIWSWIETTRIAADSPAGPTPAQVRAEVWSSLVHGASGLGYFGHTWMPAPDSAALLHDAAMLAAITAINREVTALAPVLNDPAAGDRPRIVPGDPTVAIAATGRRHDGTAYIFAVSLSDRETTAAIAVPVGTSAEVLGEDRSVPIGDGSFSDRFEPYAVHLYRIH